MFVIIFTSMLVALGSYLLRRGDLIGLILIIFQNNTITHKDLIFTLLGIFLNLIGIILWQYSSKFNIQFQVAWSMYLSLTLIFGYLISYFFERNRLDFNFYIGSILVISGIFILVRK